MANSSLVRGAMLSRRTSEWKATVRTPELAADLTDLRRGLDSDVDGRGASGVATGVSGSTTGMRSGSASPRPKTAEQLL